MSGCVTVDTRGGSRYIVEPDPDGRNVRVHRVSRTPVRGRPGPASFTERYDRVEFVASGGALRMACVRVGDANATLVTSPVVAVWTDDLEAAV